MPRGRATPGLLATWLQRTPDPRSSKTSTFKVKNTKTILMNNKIKYTQSLPRDPGASHTRVTGYLIAAHPRRTEHGAESM